MKKAPREKVKTRKVGNMEKVSVTRKECHTFKTSDIKRVQHKKNSIKIVQQRERPSRKE